MHKNLKNSPQFFKFLIVGGVSTIINYSTFYLLFSIFNIHYLYSSGTGYFTGLIVGYVLNRNWSFVEHKSSKRVTEFVKYLVLYIVSLLLSLISLELLVSILGVNALIANVVAIGISTIINFLGLKFIVFKNTTYND